MYENDTFISMISARIEKYLENDSEIETIVLHEKEIRACKGCFKCWIKSPGTCDLDDFGRIVAEKTIQADNIVFLTPITFGGYSSELKKALDRSICISLPYFTEKQGEVHHEPRYNHNANLSVFGILEASDRVREELFTTLVERNVLNMHSPQHTTQIIYRSDDADIIQKKLEQGFNLVGVPHV